MPVRNEERHLAESVSSVLGQDYPGPLELVLAVGTSRDKTLEIAEKFAAHDSRVTLVANPSGHIPSALNAAIQASKHDIIVRVDGHALLPPGYIATAVRTLKETGAVNVGGIMAARGDNPVPARSGLGHDLAGRRWLGQVPHRRRTRPGRVRLPGHLPPVKPRRR